MTMAQKYKDGRNGRPVHLHSMRSGASPTYSRWQAMKKRCLNSKASNYAYYGGRGITVCPDWLDFGKFLTDMGECPKGFFLDRINPNGHYCKDNCRWVDIKTSALNKRIYKNNKSGCSGVYSRVRSSRKFFEAYGRNKYLGEFQTLEAAIVARRIWESDNKL